ncbi:MAG: hypothetical protein NTX87_07490 [Planctomycetota bacterium]|nr:hypothetical protein [Planctomycetota bacterium]
MTAEKIKKRLAALPEADWVRRMKEYYAKTGTYRPEDLRRLLGDTNRAVKMSPDRSLAEHFGWR